MNNQQSQYAIAERAVFEERQKLQFGRAEVRKATNLLINERV